jgi:hypothetical protein
VEISTNGANKYWSDNLVFEYFKIAFKIHYKIRLFSIELKALNVHVLLSTTHKNKLTKLSK